MKYFSAIPHIVSDMDLSVYEFRLYCHYKRVAGENGRCWQSVDTISSACKMSHGAAVKAREGLLQRGLIKIERVDVGRAGRDCITVTVVDVWGTNEARYAAAPGDLQTSPGDLQTSPGDVCPPKKAVKKAAQKKPSDPRTGHPAVQAVMMATGKYPNKDVYDVVIEKLGKEPDRDKVKAAWLAWRAKGFSPVNLGWLDWYVDGIPTYGKRPVAQQPAERRDVL